MSLSRLPDEVLVEVFLEKALTNRDLCSIALVNWRFSRLVPISLYDSLDCRLNHEKRTSNLLRTLQAHPELGSMVRTVYIGSPLLVPSGKQARITSDDVVHARSVALLKCLPLLRRLLAGWVPFSDSKSSLMDVPMPFLRNVFLHLVYLNAKEVGSFILLPTIRSLDTTLNGESTTDLTHNLAGLAGRSSLKRLSLFCIGNHPELRELLALPQALEEFDCRTPFFGTLRPLSPSCALASTYSTLQRLTLISKTGADNRDDRSLTDFSPFTSLTYLKVLQIYCFPSGNNTQPSERLGLYRRLPLTLEKLNVSHFLSLLPESSGYLLTLLIRVSLTKIHFDYHASIGLGEDDDLDKVSDNRWISELAEMKTRYFPNLSWVKISEDIQFYYEGHKEWCYSGGIMDAFDAAKIHLRVMPRFNFGTEQFWKPGKLARFLGSEIDEHKWWSMHFNR